MLSYMTTNVNGEFQRGSGGALVPVMRVPPDFLDVEFDAAAEVDGLVFFAHAEVCYLGFLVRYPFH
jgi:hypothetical protein